MNFPKYILVGNTEMKLSKVENDKAIYHRHAGGWDITVIRRPLGTLTTLRTVHQYNHLNDLRVIPITKKQWLTANKEYI